MASSKFLSSDDWYFKILMKNLYVLMLMANVQSRWRRKGVKSFDHSMKAPHTFKEKS